MLYRRDYVCWMSMTRYDTLLLSWSNCLDAPACHVLIYASYSHALDIRGHSWSDG